MDLDSFRNRLAKNHRHWSRWARRSGIECYRIYDRDVPQFPLAIDRYGEHAHLQEFDTGWQITPAEHARWIAAVGAAVAATLQITPARVHYKRRERQRGAAQYERLAGGAGEFVVGENGLRFIVDLDAHVDTGLFLDHRKTRAWVREHAAGRRFLNLFAYTGSFTVHAAAGDAATTTSVDLSNTYLDWTARNLALNGLDRATNALVRADVLEWLGEAARHRRVFDLIVLDPPSFSNSARMRETLDVQRDHARLIGGAMALLSEDGQLIFSTNRRGFRLDDALQQAWHCEPISRWTIPDDFRQRPPHAAWCVVRSPSIQGIPAAN